MSILLFQRATSGSCLLLSLQQPVTGGEGCGEGVLLVPLHGSRREIVLVESGAPPS